MIMEAVAELERAASVLMSHPGVVSTDERQNAEQLFLQFRKTRNPFDLCKQILQNCKVDYVLFEAATTIREAIIREWTILKREEVDSICSFLLCCATENASLQNYVREQILQVVAIIFKLGTLEDKDARTKLIQGLTQLLSSSDRQMELVSCSIMKALLTEYSTTSQSTNFGMSLDFHAKCKKAFEEKDLLNIFMLTVQILEKFMNVQLTSLSRLDVAVFIRYLSLAEQVLHWEFMSGNPLSLLRFPVSNETAQKIIFRPHKNWKEVMLNPSLLDLFFKLFHVCVNNSELSHHCMQCLIQLASMAGSVFKSDEIQLSYFNHYITCLQAIMNCHKWKGHQAFGLANVYFRLVDVFPIKIIKMVNEQLLLSFFESMAYLTCHFQEAAVSSTESDVGDNEYLEAANLLLDAWTTIVSHTEDFKPGFFVNYSLKIVDVYVKSRLAPPDGIRKIEDGNDADEIDHEIVEDDRVACHDELSDIGQLSRQCLHHVVPLLTHKMEDRIIHLKTFFEHEKQKNHSGSRIETSASDNLFEDIHWLVLISTFVLTIGNDNESPQISSEVVDFNNQFLTAHKHTIGPSVKYLMALGKEGTVANVDPVTALVTSILKIVEVEMNFLKHNLNSSFSPEVSSTLLWFLKRFTKGYIVAGDTDDCKLSPTLLACFSLQHDCGKFIVSLLLDIVEVNLSAWSAEPRVAEDVVKLILRLFMVDNRAEVCLTFPNLWNIAKKFSSRLPEISALPPATHRLLVECLVRACSKVKDKPRMEHMLTELLHPLHEEYKAARSKPNLDTAKPEILRMFECVRGISKATSACSSPLLLEFMLPILEDSVSVLKSYNGYPEVTVAVIEMFVDTVDALICSLDKKNSNRLCKLCLQMMENYSKFNLGKKTIGTFEEEDQYYDLLLLIQLLTHILSKEYLDFSALTDDSSGEEAICPVDVVLYGFHLIIPLINQELIKYPKLSNEYFKLVTFVCEVYPEKMKTLPADLFQKFMASIQMAISEFGTDTSKCALDALSSLAKYYFNECDHSDTVNKQLFDALQHFLNIVFQHIVLGLFNMDLIEPSAEALFLLICCNKQEYLKLANNLIAQQHVTDESFKEKLINAFQFLTPADLQLTPNRQSLKVFRKKLETFLQNVKGFLCFK